jgi:methyl-accepting chemotaxis protein
MLNRLTTGTQILLGFCFALAVATAVGLVGLGSSKLVNARLDRLAIRDVPSLVAIGELRAELNGVARAISLNLDKRVTKDNLAAGVKDLDDRLAAVEETGKRYQALPRSAAEEELWRHAREHLDRWRAAVVQCAGITKKQLALMQDGYMMSDLEVMELQDAAWKLAVEAGPLLQETDRAFLELAAEVEKQAAAGQQAAEAAARRALLGSLLALCAGAAVLVALAGLVARRIGRSVKALVSESDRLRGAVAAGQLGERGDPGLVSDEFQPVIEGINETMEAFQRPITVTAELAQKLGRGEIPEKLAQDGRARGEFAAIRDSLNACIDAVNALVADTGRLARAGAEGRLSVRADASRHQGDFRKIVQGVNDSLDAITGPLRAAGAVVAQLARGSVPARITAEYRGDFAVMKQNLNQCLDAVDALVADAEALVRAGTAGQLSVRADASRHQGDFRKIVEGVNRTLDAVIGPLTAAASVVDQLARGSIPPPVDAGWPGDFAHLEHNLNTCIAAVNRLVAEAEALVEAAVAGQLSVRADVAKHEGDFRRIVEGVNRTLDAVVAPVAEASEVLERLAKRDLRARATGEFQGDHARLQQAVNATASALHDSLIQVANATDQVSSASQQIASSSQAVAAGATEQAASLVSTTGSLETVSGMVRQAADHSQQANGLAQSARAAAAEGAQAVEQMQGAMVRARAAAEGTSQIIRDVSDIAFQTNLLALNAAVEAARAGEAGRGFAVVAEEVRSLALRAKEAATKTEELIRQSVKEAGAGETAARRVSDQLGQIVGGSEKVTAIIGEIAAAAQEQQRGIEQVRAAITEMDRVIQQNAASAEQSSAAAAELSGQSEELAAMVGTFQLERQAGAGRRRKAPRVLPLPAPALPASAPARTLGTPGKPPPVAADQAFPMDDDTELREF